ncbi:MAG TPA: amino acid adenylation domain-containing protein [Bryobacteraceae bacterium]|jgi:amino acid adenylation domain-containing protein|nr:amino acid adenylation domain-containing protein [Bryobacteraceae bacterium]
MSEQNPVLEDLSSEQRELFLRRLAAHRENSNHSHSAAEPVAAQDRQEHALSTTQSRIWYYEQLVPGNRLYNLPSVLELIGPLDVTSLEAAVNKIIERHRILTATFEDRNGAPVQIIRPNLRISVPVIDLRNLSGEEADQEIRRLALEHGKYLFDLRKGPLLKLTIISVSENRNIALFNTHHIVGDQWSAAILMKELAICYPAIAAGVTPNLAPLKVQYTDYIRWEQQALSQAAIGPHVAWWERRLQGPLSRVELPADYHCDYGSDYRGHNIQMKLDASVTKQFRAICQKAGATLFMGMLAGFKLLLHRLTSQTDIVLGTPIANRGRNEFEPLIGLFLNVLVLRTEVQGNFSFVNLLQRIRETVLGAWAHKDVPFEMLVSKLQIEREFGRHPVFDILFNYLNTPPISVVFGNIVARPLRLADSESRFAITLYIQEQEDEGLAFELEYQRARLSEARMRQVMHQFQYLLEQIARSPEKGIGEYSLAAPDHRHLLADPTAHLVSPQTTSIGKLFENCAYKHPDRTAITQLERSWTWRDFHRTVSSLVVQLQEKGLKKGDVVAVCGPRCFGVISAMTAALSSGGILLPIDPALPPSQRSIMLREARARFLFVTEPEPMCDRPEMVVMLLGKDDVLTGELVPMPDVSPSDPAYIFFTSGTTGVPKGVLGVHKGLSRFVEWQQRTFRVGPEDRCSQLIGLSFHIVLRDIYLAVSSGASLYLPDTDMTLAPEQILPWLEKNQITVIHTVPTVAASWLSHVPPGVSLRSVRWIFSGGEPLRDTFLRRWRSNFPQAGPIVNFYGSTEATLAQCFNPLDPDLIPGIQPVGRPLPGTQALVLRNGNQLCGLGEPGEIAFRSQFLTAGYINAPDQNRKRFLPNPFTGEESDRIYLMGDRGRLRPDGQLEVLGRIDTQIKIRGVRIELGEIESALCLHPAVRDAAAKLWNDGGDDFQLAGYITLRPGLSATAEELRKHCRGLLQDAKVPTAFVVLDRLPFTRNGKLDRRALPKAANPLGSAKPPVVARTPIEETLCSIWSTLLHKETVGVHDNFFEIGGHSLLATHVSARVRSAFEIDAPLAWLLQGPTIAELAVHIEASRRGAAAPKFELSHSSEPDPAPPLSYPQRRLWFLDQLDPGGAAYNVPSPVRMGGRVDAHALRRAFCDLVNRHEPLRARFHDSDGTPVQTIVADNDISLPIVDISEIPAVHRLAVAEAITRKSAAQPFDLIHGPLLRTCLIRLDQDDHVLALTAHHIACDGWSLGVLIRDTALLYSAFRDGQEPELPPLDLRYADFARWQHAWIESSAAEDQLAYWRGRLEGAPPLQLPTDHARQPGRSAHAAWHRIYLPLELVDRLKVLARSQATTLFAVLLTGFKVLLYQYSGQEDLVVGSTYANRTPATEALIGFFANTVALRTDLSGNPTLAGALKLVTKTVLGAYAHQELPFDKIVQELRPARGLETVPFARALFTLQTTFLPSLHKVGLHLESIPLHREVAQTDLIIDLLETSRGLLVAAEYNCEIFERPTIQRFLERFTAVLEAIALNPETNIQDIDLLSLEEAALLDAASLSR